MYMYCCSMWSFWYTGLLLIIHSISEHTKLCITIHDVILHIYRTSVSFSTFYEFEEILNLFRASVDSEIARIRRNSTPVVSRQTGRNSYTFVEILPICRCFTKIYIIDKFIEFLLTVSTINRFVQHLHMC